MLPILKASIINNINLCKNWWSFHTLAQRKATSTANWIKLLFASFSLSVSSQFIILSNTSIIIPIVGKYLNYSYKTTKEIL